MHRDLASSKEVIDLSPQETLDKAAAFVEQHGYEVVRRSATTLIVQRTEDAFLTIVAVPQPGGGVKVKLSGTDAEGVEASRSAWQAWFAGLPKKGADVALRPASQVSTVDLQEPPPSPPTSAPPPSQGSTVWRGAKLAIGGCIVLPLLLGLGLVGCLAVVGGLEGGDPSEEELEAIAEDELGDKLRSVEVDPSINESYAVVIAFDENGSLNENDGYGALSIEDEMASTYEALYSSGQTLSVVDIAAYMDDCPTPVYESKLNTMDASDAAAANWTNVADKWSGSFDVTAAC